MTCRRGDVVLVLFPDSNLRTAKRRPALVIQSDHLGTALPQAIVAMITSNSSRQGHRSRVYVDVSKEPGKRTGLLMDSVIMTDNLATIAYSEIDRIYWVDVRHDRGGRGFAIHSRARGLVIQRRRSARTLRCTSFQASPEVGFFRRFALRRASSCFCHSWIGTASGVEARSSQRSSTRWSFSEGVRSNTVGSRDFIRSDRFSQSTANPRTANLCRNWIREYGDRE